MAREIPLSRGLVTIVDDEDYWHLSWFKWSALPGGGGNFRAARRDRNFGPGWLLLHRVIAGAPEGMVVDHINGDMLDNRRANLRICTQAENARNRRGLPGRDLPKGVSQKGSRFLAKICCNGRRVQIGSYATPEEAARAYDMAAYVLHGDFAKTNFDVLA